MKFIRRRKDLPEGGKEDLFHREFSSKPKQPISLQGRTNSKGFHFKIRIVKHEAPNKTESSRPRPLESAGLSNMFDTS